MTGRWGWFEAPAVPDHEPRLHVDPAWSPARLTGAIIASVWRFALAGALLRLVFNVAGMLLPVAIGSLVDRTITPMVSGAGWAEVAPGLATGTGALIGIYALTNIGYRFGGRLGWYGVQRAQFELSQQAVARVLDDRGMSGPTIPPGRLLSLVTADARRACQSVYIAVYPPGELVGLLVAAGVLFWVHPALGAVVVAALPLMLGVMHLAALPLRRRSRSEQARLADAAASAADVVAGYRVLRGVHAERVAAARYRRVSREALRTTIAARASQAAFDGISTAVGNLFAATVIATAVVLASTGQITVGALVTAAALAVGLLGPVEGLIGTLGSMWAMSQASAERLLGLLATPPNPAALGTAHPGGTGGTGGPALEFDRLALTDGAVLDGRVEQGELVVLSLSYADRGVLADLLALRARPASGRIVLDGIPLPQHRPDLLRERLLAAPHTAGLLTGTVLDNVRATGDRPVGEAPARRALHVACLDATELPEGFDTAIGDGGWHLSGGQRQRTALARAVAAEPDLLVLDDPTTSVDTVTENAIATRLRAHRRGRTTIVVTSSPSFHAVADRVVTAEPGARVDA